MGQIAPGAVVRWRTDDDGLVDLHDGPLDGVGEGTTGGGPHMHDHTALRSGHLQHQTADECVSHV